MEGKWPMGDAMSRELDAENGIERELEDDEAAADLTEPFNPEDIDVVTRQMTIDLLLSRIRAGAINLHPDFQRRWGIWDLKRQSRLIESLLLRIPLPTLYAAEDANEDWEIVDGIQRLSTIARFVEPSLLNGQDREEGKTEAPLCLQGMEYLHDLNNKTFDGLNSRLQRRIRETELVVHLIRRGTPETVKYNIFARINTGGKVLSPQELRHALVPGPARRILEDWAQFPEFLAATAGSVRSTRMDDRELVLRFAAFRLTPYTQYLKQDMDGFLISAMNGLNRLPNWRISAIALDFQNAMTVAEAVFGNDAFRKRYRSGAARAPINKALFETFSVALSQLNPEERSRVTANAQSLREGLIALCNDRDFDRSISQGTGDIGKVRLRFHMVDELVREVANDVNQCHP